MKLRILTQWLILLVTSALSFHGIAYENQAGGGQQPFERKEKQRILVLNSYSHGYRWTDNIVRAIEDTFEDNPNIIMNIEYMDTKMIDNSDHSYHFEQLRNLYKHKYSGYKIDVIISSDDDALKFLREYRDELFPGAPVVFCGVNNFNERKVQDFHSYTGVSEESGFASNFELILSLHPDVKTFYVINDSLTTARSLQTELFAERKEYEDRFDLEILSDYSLQDLINKVSSLEKDSIVYYLSFFSDNTGRSLTPGEVIPYISKVSPVPVYGSVDYMMGHGIVGGMLGSGYYQGETAAKLAQKILDGYSVDKIPVVLDNPNTYMFDYNHLDRFGISVADLPEGTVVINQPENFLEKNKPLIIVVIAFFVLLIIYLSLLVTTARKRTRTREGLQKITSISSESLDIRSTEAFKDTLLTQLNQILPIKSAIVLKMAVDSDNFDQYDIVYLQGSGKYNSVVIEEGRYFLPDNPLKMIEKTFNQRKGVIKKNAGVILLKGDLSPITMIYVETKHRLDVVANNLLTLFGEKVSMVLENLEKYKMEESIDSARDIQMGMLPTNFVEFNYKNPVDLKAFLSPVKEVGGDLYDFFAKGKDKIVFAVGDVAGRGVPAALFMTVVKTLIRSVSEQYDKPGEILHKINNELYRNNEQSISVTLFLGIFDISKSELCYANANHEPPYFVDPKGSVQSIAVSKSVALGCFENVEFANEDGPH